MLVRGRFGLVGEVVLLRQSALARADRLRIDRGQASAVALAVAHRNQFVFGERSWLLGDARMAGRVLECKTGIGWLHGHLDDGEAAGRGPGLAHEEGGPRFRLAPLCPFLQLRCLAREAFRTSRTQARPESSALNLPYVAWHSRLVDSGSRPAQQFSSW